MPLVTLQNIGLQGLNSDTPSQSLDVTEFSDGIDLRPFDGSLQGVYDFGRVDENVNGPDDDQEGGNINLGTIRNIYAMTQWTKSGENVLNVAYLFDSDGDGNNLTFQIVRDLDSDGSEFISGATAMTPTDDNSRFGIDMFVFNDIVIINGGQNHPVWLMENNGAYSAQLLPGWPSGSVDSVTDGGRYVVLSRDTLTAQEFSDISGDSDIQIGTVFTAAANLATDPSGDLGTPVQTCLLYTSPSPRDRTRSRMPSSA